MTFWPMALVWECGDGDGVCRRSRGLMPDDLEQNVPRLQMLTMMNNIDGTPFAAPIPQVLAGVVARSSKPGADACGCRPELEFYLMAGDLAGEGRPRPPPRPESGSRPGWTPRVYSMEELNEFVDDVHDRPFAMFVRRRACPAIIHHRRKWSGAIRGQFAPCGRPAARPPTMPYCLRRAVRAVIAPDLGCMPLFYGQTLWNGGGKRFPSALQRQLDADGRNVFDDGTSQGQCRLAAPPLDGMIALMPESMLIFCAASRY